MRILLDENMPRKLQNALIAEATKSTPWSLSLDGIDNGALYQLAARAYDLCYPRRGIREPSS